MTEAAMTAKAVLGALAMMALQGTLLAVIVYVLARWLRARPALVAALWLVVLAKFALPWGPQLPWSLADVIETLRGGEDIGVVLFSAPAPVQATAATASVSPVWLVLGAAWAAGALAVLARALVLDRLARRRAVAAAPAPASARALLGELAARVRVRPPRLVVGAADVGPHVVGVLRPIIVVPPALAGDLVLLRPALLHELAHVRRRDALARIVQIVACAVFWCWPVVRLASRRLEHAREAACDAWALEAGDVSRPQYARLLVQMARLRHGALALAAPAALDDRVTGVLGPPVRPRLAKTHWLALAMFAVIGLGGARRSTAATGPNVCVYTLQIAEALRLAHPEADVDGDGLLSHDEACDLQAEMARRVLANPEVSTLDELLAEPLCCNCDAAEGISSPATPNDSSCQSEGVVR